MIVEGLGLMIVGMAVVFVFLALLVGVMQVAAFLFVKYAPRQVQADVRPAAAGRAPQDQADIALVIAAVKHHTSR